MIPSGVARFIRHADWPFTTSTAANAFGRTGISATVPVRTMRPPIPPDRSTRQRSLPVWPSIASSDEPVLYRRFPRDSPIEAPMLPCFFFDQMSSPVAIDRASSVPLVVP